MTGISPEEKEKFIEKDRKRNGYQKNLKEMEEELDDELKVETDEK